MPGYRGHLFGAMGVIAICVALLMLGSIVLNVQHIFFVTIFSIFVILGALFPDTDTDSKGQRLLYGMLFFFLIYLIARREFEFAAYLGLFACLPCMSKHRGWTHAWWAMFVVPIPLLFLPYFPYLVMPVEILNTKHGSIWFYLAFFLGYFSHLLLDGVLLTKKQTQKKLNKSRPF